MILFQIFCFSLTLEVISSTFSPDFQSFLLNQYGSNVEKSMTRADMGIGLSGSFGGKTTADEIIKNQPVIFVHGVTLRAGVFTGHVQYFHQHGYTMAELYGTTYADGGKTIMIDKNMTCEDVKQIRQFILAVNQYTNSAVDIIAYSMGSPITRKAILGGKCVDTGEYLGEPLTEIVDTFLSIAGVVHGVENCDNVFNDFNVCNPINGMKCTSEYMKDINAQQYRYEGKYSFSLYSTDDLVVGQKCCGHQCSELEFGDNKSVHKLLDHVTILITTKEIQLKIIRDHWVPSNNV